MVRLGSTVRAAYISDSEVPDAAGGSGHGPVIALHHPKVPPAIAVSKVSLPGAWLLRWPSYLPLVGGLGPGADSKTAAERWLAQIQWANNSMLAAVGHPAAQVLGSSPPVTSSASYTASAAAAAAAAVATAVAANPVTFELHGELGHLKVLLSGQPMGTGDNVDDDNKGLAAIGIDGMLDGPAPGEELIVNFSAKAARVRLTTTATDMRRPWRCDPWSFRTCSAATSTPALGTSSLWLVPAAAATAARDG